jgi:pimeloyl-ACP methyl ester carboxylesterase
MSSDFRDLLDAWELLMSQRERNGREAQLPDPTPPEGPDPYGDPDPEWLGIDWREHLRTVEAADTPVHYVEMGSGRSLVFVHGLAGCWQNWLEQIPHFARTHRVLALDLSGFGRSPMPPWDISIPAYGGLVHEFCDAVGADDAVVVGNSLGGFVAAEAVCSDPARFDKLGLVSAAGISSASVRPEPAALAGRLAVGLAPLALAYQDQAIRRPKLRHSAFKTVFHKPNELRRELLYEQYTNGSGKAGFLPALTSVVGYDFIERLEEVDTETLIVWGRNDLIVPPSDATEYGSLLRNSSTVIFDHTGHCPQLERPVRFNRLLDAFLATP